MTIWYGVLVASPVTVMEWLVTSERSSTNEVDVEDVFTGVVIDKKTLLVAGSFVFQVNLRVEVPTTVIRLVMIGAATSAGVPVVNETGTESVTFPAVSRELMTAKYVVLALSPASVMLWLVTFVLEETTCVAVALVFTGRDVPKKTALSAFSFVVHVIVAEVTAGVATMEEMIGATVSVEVPLGGT